MTVNSGLAAESFQNVELSLEERRKLCSEIVDVLKKLKDNRNMSYKEALLVVQIEDPVQKANRLAGLT